MPAPQRQIIGEQHLDAGDIRYAELERARHALAYLKGRLGNDAMRALLADDLHTMQAKVRGWVEASGSAWRTGSVTLMVPGPGAGIPGLVCRSGGRRA